MLIVLDIIHLMLMLTPVITTTIRRLLPKHLVISMGMLQVPTRKWSSITTRVICFCFSYSRSMGQGQQSQQQQQRASFY